MSFTSFAEVVAAALVRRVPADAVLRAVDARLESEAEPLAAERIGGRRLGDRAAELDRLGDALDRQLAASPRRGRRRARSSSVARKAISGIACRVEEVGRLEVAVQLLVLDVDARDLRAALERRPLAAREGRLEVGEAAAERVHARVADLERDVRVDGIRGPRAGRGEMLASFGD